jgi:hypothetical protein
MGVTVPEPNKFQKVIYNDENKDIIPASSFANVVVTLNPYKGASLAKYASMYERVSITHSINNPGIARVSIEAVSVERNKRQPMRYDVVSGFGWTYGSSIVTYRKENRQGCVYVPPPPPPEPKKDEQNGNGSSSGRSLAKALFGEKNAQHQHTSHKHHSHNKEKSSVQSLIKEKSSGSRHTETKSADHSKNHHSSVNSHTQFTSSKHKNSQESSSSSSHPQTKRASHRKSQFSTQPRNTSNTSKHRSSHQDNTSLFSHTQIKEASKSNISPENNGLSTENSKSSIIQAADDEKKIKKDKKKKSKKDKKKKSKKQKKVVTTVQLPTSPKSPQLATPENNFFTRLRSPQANRRSKISFKSKKGATQRKNRSYLSFKKSKLTRPKKFSLKSHFARLSQNVKKLSKSFAKNLKKFVGKKVTKLGKKFKGKKASWSDWKDAAVKRLEMIRLKRASKKRVYLDNSVLPIQTENVFDANNQKEHYKCHSDKVNVINGLNYKQEMAVATGLRAIVLHNAAIKLRVESHRYTHIVEAKKIDFGDFNTYQKLTQVKNEDITKAVNALLGTYKATWTIINFINGTPIEVSIPQNGKNVPVLKIACTHNSSKQSLFDITALSTEGTI